jgi:phage terminase small subunit
MRELGDTQPPIMKALTPRQQRFVQEYIVDLNATQAAIRAGYSERGARVRGVELLTNRNVKTAIARTKEERRLRLELEADDVVRHLVEVAFANIADFATWTESKVRLRPSEEIEESKLVAVHSITNGPNGVTIRLHDKLRALELLAKHLGMFKDRNEVDLKISNGADVVGRLMVKLDDYHDRSAA